MEQGIKSDKNIGMNIRAFRIKRKMTQEQLSARLQVLGCDISRGTLAKIEVGIRHISADELRAIKTALDMKYEEFFDLSH